MQNCRQLTEIVLLFLFIISIKMNLHKCVKYTTPLLTTKKAYSKEVVSSVDYCANIVRQHDHENFLATLLLSKDVRSPALVLRAFNVEVARIQDQTSDSQTAAFRLQFWTDTIQKIYKNDQIIKNIPANPIAQELFKICTTYSLSKRNIDKLVLSRNKLLKTKHFHSLDDIEKYSEDSVSAIYFLLLGVVGVKNVHADHVSSHLGKAQGITNVLRSIHVSNYHKMVLLPMEILMKHQLSQESVLRGLDNENMRNVTFEVATRANNHLKKARSISIPKEAKQLFLPAVAVDSYLSKLEKCNFNIFDNKLKQGNAILPLSLYYNKFLGKF